MSLTRTREYLLFWHPGRETWMVAPIRRSGHHLRTLGPDATAVGEPPWVGSTSTPMFPDPDHPAAPLPADPPPEAPSPDPSS